MGKAKRRRLRRKKGSQPRLAALISPFQGKGLAWSFPPSRGRWKMPPHRLPTKKAYDTRMLFSPYCHFERKREIFFVRGQAKDVRIAASWKHRASSESEGRCFMQTALRKKTETGNEKDPSAALGSPFQGKGLAGHSLLPMEGGAPKGRRLDGESGMKKSGGDHLKQAIYESTRAPLARSSFPNGAMLLS